MLKILMAVDNPEGRTVESLIDDMIHDLKIKNKRIDDDKTPSDDKLNERIKQNNKFIIEYLGACMRYQEDTMKSIEDWKERNNETV